ncbi:MAG: hypothetical protein QOC96_509 [Acidobacteriota bacterium]|jgi:hypothetical protein|nr:hypothetical protein [Acidobacteriota bacterium]
MSIKKEIIPAEDAEDAEVKQGLKEKTTKFEMTDFNSLFSLFTLRPPRPLRLICGHIQSHITIVQETSIIIAIAVRLRPSPFAR